MARPLTRKTSAQLRPRDDDKITCEAKRYFGGMTVSATVVDDQTIDFKADPAQPILPYTAVAGLDRPEETPSNSPASPSVPALCAEGLDPSQQIVLAERDGWGTNPP